jgi:hypothetical protein
MTGTTVKVLAPVKGGDVPGRVGKAEAQISIAEMGERAAGGIVRLPNVFNDVFSPEFSMSKNKLYTTRDEFDRVGKMPTSSKVTTHTTIVRGRLNGRRVRTTPPPFRIEFPPPFFLLLILLTPALQPWRLLPGRAGLL